MQHPLQKNSRWKRIRKSQTVHILLSRIDCTIVLYIGTADLGMPMSNHICIRRVARGRLPVVALSRAFTVRHAGVMRHRRGAANTSGLAELVQRAWNYPRERAKLARSSPRRQLSRCMGTVTNGMRMRLSAPGFASSGGLAAVAVRRASKPGGRGNRSPSECSPLKRCLS